MMLTYIVVSFVILSGVGACRNPCREEHCPLGKEVLIFEERRGLYSRAWSKEVTRCYLAV